MTDARTAEPPPWEPPLAGTERDQLVGAIERQRATFQWKTDGLDAEGLRTRIDTSALTLGGLLEHLALVEDFTFTEKLAGQPMGSPWDELGWGGSDPDWEFTSAADDTPAQLYALWDGAVARSRARLDAALRGGGLESNGRGSPGGLEADVAAAVVSHGGETLVVLHDCAAARLRCARLTPFGTPPPTPSTPRTRRGPLRRARSTTHRLASA